jgi:hypothetical protein
VIFLGETCPHFFTFDTVGFEEAVECLSEAGLIDRLVN